VGGGSLVSRGVEYRTVAAGSGEGAPSLMSGVPSSRQKFSDTSVYVRLQLGQRFILGARLTEFQQGSDFGLFAAMEQGSRQTEKRKSAANTWEHYMESTPGLKQ